MLKTYDLTRVILTLGGQRIEGFAPDSEIKIDFASELIETQVGSDGKTTVSRTNNKNATATISVFETSLSYKALGALMQAQQIPNSIPPLEFMLLDPINGDRVTTRYAVFRARPSIAKGKSASAREFILELIEPQVAFGTLIAI